MDKREIKEMLQLEGKEQEELFEEARNIRRKYQGDFAYIRAIIEPSNYCRSSCHYCAMRKDSRLVRRYRMNSDEIFDIANQIANKGVGIFSLETGEDPEVLNEIFKSAKFMKEREYWILGAFGDLEKEDYRKLKDVGIDAYLLKFETSDARNFKRLRPGTTLQKRLKNLEYIKKLGFDIATGNIIGLPGQTLDSIADDIILTKSFEPFTATASPFIPSPGTPVENKKYGNINLTLNTIAIYRLLLPKSHIPALCALNFYPGRSQHDALNAGANDVLINTAKPESISYNFAIYSKKKQCVFLDEALKIIEEAGLKFNPFKKAPLFKGKDLEKL